MKARRVVRQSAAIFLRWLQPRRYLTNLVRQRTNSRVYGGPFTGMRYVTVEEAAGARFFSGPHLARLLGRFERELVPKVEYVVAENFDELTVVGAAEGYYAIGFALRLPGATVQAFELNAKSRALMATMATRNDVADRVVIHGKCETDLLSTCLNGNRKPFVLCDVEGYESELMDPQRVPELEKAYILVELHEFKHPGIGQLLRRRFEHSHTTEELCQQRVPAEDFPFSTFFTRLIPRFVIAATVREPRPEKVSWLWLQPKAHVTIDATRIGAETDESRALLSS